MGKITFQKETDALLAKARRMLKREKMAEALLAQASQLMAKQAELSVALVEFANHLNNSIPSVGGEAEDIKDAFEVLNTKADSRRTLEQKKALLRRLSNLGVRSRQLGSEVRRFEAKFGKAEKMVEYELRMEESILALLKKIKKLEGREGDLIKAEEIDVSDIMRQLQREVDAGR